MNSTCSTSGLALEISDDTMNAWQEIVDIIAEIVGVKACLIMKLQNENIEVLASSSNSGNPYHPGDKEVFEGSGLYCEVVIKTKNMLFVPNALNDLKWKSSPDVGLNMISYLGFPIRLPDGRPFGTICVLDNKEKQDMIKYEKILSRFRNLLESEIGIIFMNQALGDKNRRLSDYLLELQSLRGLVLICANCKNVKDVNGVWHPIEHFLIQHPEAHFSHGICPECMKTLYPEYTTG